MILNCFNCFLFFYYCISINRMHEFLLVFGSNAPLILLLIAGNTMLMLCLSPVFTYVPII